MRAAHAGVSPLSCLLTWAWSGVPPVVCAQVMLALRRSVPVYWEGEQRRVLRGLWFAKKPGLAPWLPLREDLAEQLEAAYEGKVGPRSAGSRGLPCLPHLPQPLPATCHCLAFVHCLLACGGPPAAHAAALECLCSCSVLRAPWAAPGCALWQVWRRRSFQPSGVFAARVPLVGSVQVGVNLATHPSSHVLWPV